VNDGRTARVEMGRTELRGAMLLALDFCRRPCARGATVAEAIAAAPYGVADRDRIKAALLAMRALDRLGRPLERVDGVTLWDDADGGDAGLTIRWTGRGRAARKEDA
jgi:phage tail protein X